MTPTADGTAGTSEARPTPDDLRAELVARARALVPMLREAAPRADSARRLPHDVVEQLEEAGLFRLWQPRRYGGYETDLRTQVEVCSEVARGCAASAWVLALTNACSWLTCLFNDQAQDDVFGAHPKARVCGILTPGGPPAVAVDGGYLVSGSWGWASGCYHSDWAAVPAPLADESGQVVNAGLMLIPIHELEIKDTWHTVGMRGTGSNTLVGSDILVPAHRMVPLMGPAGAFEGISANQHRDTETLYRTPLGALACIALVGPVLGMARHALEAVTERLPRRAINYTSYARQSDAASNQVAIAEAATKIDTAILLVQRAAEAADDCARRDQLPELAERTRTRADVAYAARTAREAVDSLMQLSGASSMATVGPLQQIFRDVSTASLHALLQPLAAMELHGRVLAGNEPAISIIY